MTVFSFILAQCLSALSQAAILFFIACGLTLIFGIMRIVNFAHGVVFMLGAYAGYTAQAVTGSFVMAMVLAPVFVVTATASTGRPSRSTVTRLGGDGKSQSHTS